MSAARFKRVYPHHCPDAHGLVVDVESRCAIGLGGDPAHPVTRGWCELTASLSDIARPGVVAFDQEILVEALQRAQRQLDHPRHARGPRRPEHLAHGRVWVRPAP